MAPPRPPSRLEAALDACAVWATLAIAYAVFGVILVLRLLQAARRLVRGLLTGALSDR